MVEFRPLYWSLITLLLAVIHPSLSHPIRTSKWIKKDQFADAESRGVWKVFEKNEHNHEPSLSQTKSIKVGSLPFALCISN